MEMQLTGNGQRWSRRIAVDIPVRVAADGSPTIHGHLKDLSLSGALLTTDHALRLHAYIEISIKAREGHGAVRVMARVTRNLEGGVGVEWCEFASSAVTDLLRSPSF
jgi:PilZ domain